MTSFHIINGALVILNQAPLYIEGKGSSLVKTPLITTLSGLCAMLFEVNERGKTRLMSPFESLFFLRLYSLDGQNVANNINQQHRLH